MYRTCALVLALSASLAIAAALALAETPWASPPPSVLLLRNGRTLEGKIARDGDYYLIARPQGEVRLRADQVEAAFAGFVECYEFKRSRLFADSPDDRLELAGWCISHGLLDQAEAELAEVGRIWPKHPRIALVHRRLESARQPPKPAATAKVTQDGPSEEELSDLVKSLPRGTMEAFTSTVQPILQMHCAAGGCHGPSTTSRFRLERISPEHVTGKLSQRNLLAVLNEIDARSPKNSPLLQQARQPHGSSKGPIFAEHQLSRYRQLATFVDYAKSAGRAGAGEQAAGGKTQAQPASFVKDEAGEGPTQDEEPGTLPRREEPDVVEPMEPSPAEATGQFQATPRENDALGFSPRDAYDPEIFNRRHGTRRPSP